MTFIPYEDKILIKPFKQEGIILSDKDKLIEKGEVIAVGGTVTWPVNAGDVVHFLSFGCNECILADGSTAYVVTCNSDTILGKEPA